MAASLATSALAFLAIFAGAVGGVWLASRLPEPHLSSESQTAISVSMAVVGTMAALVLSLLISNASSSFNTQVAAIDDLAVDVVKLNRTLIRYGRDTIDIRQALRAYAAAKAAELSERDSRSDRRADTLRLLERVSDDVMALRPQNAREQQIQQRTLILVNAMMDARWTLAETVGAAIPHVFLVVLIFWLTLLFASFGLFAPRNQTVLVALLLCALAISGGIFLTLELGSPNDGLIRVSVAPIELAVQQLQAAGD